MIKNIKNKLINIPRPIIASIIYMLIVFFQSGVNLITTPIFSRLLSTAEFGITSTYQSWYNILSIFLTLNLSAGVYNNALLDFENEKDKITSSFLSISVMITMIAFIIFLCFKRIIVNALNISEQLIYFMFINFLSAPAWAFFLAREKFNYNFLKPLIISSITFILNPLLGIIGINLFPNDKAIAKIIFSGLPIVFVNFFMLVYIFKKGKCLYDKKIWKYALSFNIPLIPHYLSGIILSQSDRIMIQRILGNSAAGIYGVSYNLSQVIMGVYTGINAILLPFTYKNLKKNNYEKIEKYANYMLLFVGYLSVLLAVCAPEIICILAPIEYYDAIYVIPPIILGLYFSFMASLFGNIEFYYKKNIFVTIATTCAAILNIVLNAIFIPKYGFAAAGYTTAVGYLGLAIVHYIFMKKIQVKKVYDGKLLLIISLLIFINVCVVASMYNLFCIKRYFISFICIGLTSLFFVFKYVLKKKGENNFNDKTIDV